MQQLAPHRGDDLLCLRQVSRRRFLAQDGDAALTRRLDRGQMILWRRADADGIRLQGIQHDRAVVESLAAEFRDSGPRHLFHYIGDADDFAALGMGGVRSQMRAGNPTPANNRDSDSVHMPSL